MDAKVNVGLMGVGNIAPAYVRGCKQYGILDLVACADIDASRTKQFANEHSLQAMTVDEMLGSNDIDIIINLTIPKVHAKVSLSIIDAGKHVYSEKPLGLTRAEGAEIVQRAKDAKVLIGCAPDTFLGGGGQTCRKLIDDGWIGTPVAATAFMAGHGPESWHPNPFFFYQFGGGPLFDMGPYYLTALVNLLGPVNRVAGLTNKSFEKRIATSESQYGVELPVEVNTHVAGTLQFDGGALATVMMSFDVWKHQLPRIEIYGSEGTLSVPDPNTFGGSVRVWLAKDGEWRDIPLTHSSDIGRGTGVADMAYALQSGRPHRASGDLAFHVLDVMCAFDESSKQGQHIDISSTVARPQAIPLGLLSGMLDK